MTSIDKIAAFLKENSVRFERADDVITTITRSGKILQISHEEAEFTLALPQDRWHMHIMENAGNTESSYDDMIRNIDYEEDTKRFIIRLLEDDLFFSSHR